MKLIIEIPEDLYKEKIKGTASDRQNEKILECVKNSTPLEAIKTDVHRHKMDFYPSDYALINTLIDKWINKGVDI